eukprot:scaffold31065_cov38-Prasinocladus_malaysianus.AAC.2
MYSVFSLVFERALLRLGTYSNGLWLLMSPIATTLARSVVLYLLCDHDNASVRSSQRCHRVRFFITVQSLDGR